MNSLAQTSSATNSWLQRNSVVGWSAIVSSLSLIIVGQKPYFPPSWSLVLAVGALALYLGMIPVIRWMGQGLTTHYKGDAGRAIRVVEITGLTGAGVAAITVLLALPHWLPAVPTQILDTSALGVIGLWLMIVSALAFRVRLYNRVLAILGALAGVGWLLAAVVMWVELMAGNLGNLVSGLETFRALGGYVASAFYLIWALWLGLWLLIRKR